MVVVDEDVASPSATKTRFFVGFSSTLFFSFVRSRFLSFCLVWSNQVMPWIRKDCVQTWRRNTTWWNGWKMEFPAE